MGDKSWEVEVMESRKEIVYMIPLWVYIIYRKDEVIQVKS